MNEEFILRPYIIKANSAGLCNQLIFIINGILFCSKHKISNLLITDFITDNLNLTTKPIHEIINLNETNEFLKKYNVFITGSKNVSNNDKINYTSLETNWINEVEFFDIFHNIKFKDQYYNLSINLIKEIKFKLGDDIKINVIHLRIESDSIIHWSKMNKMNPISFYKKLEQKYIYLINKFINKNAFTIVMTYSTKNNVINFLKMNGYNFFISRKDLSIGRECNALKDLLLARQMNNFFICTGGSTFSHLINNSTPNKKKTIIFDINNIINPESVQDF
jgi:hypothetical protein